MTTTDDATTTQCSLRAAIESLGGTLTSATVLSPQVDPFRMDTPGNHRDGKWLADTWERIGITGPIHNRGLHYVLLNQPKPDGSPYATTDWQWLVGVSNAARWLRYIPFDQIVDNKHAAPVLRLWKPPQPRPYVAVDFDVVVPDAYDLQPYIGVTEFTGSQLYHLALIGEKSSLDNVLGPVAARYGADLYLPTGCISNTRIHDLAANAAADGRPLVVLYFADCDPSGWNMPIEVARKLQAFKTMHYPELEFECHRAALTPDQVRQYDLPISPVKETDKRWQAWSAATGVEQTEIDALATLQPQLLRRIAEDAIAPFFDRTLDVRVDSVKDEWRQDAQQVLDDHTGDMEWLRDDVAAQIAQKRDEIQELLQAVRVDTDRLELPPIPDIPRAANQTWAQPKPLCDSRWPLAEQIRRLKASKNYDDGEMGADQ